MKKQEGNVFAEKEADCFVFSEDIAFLLFPVLG